MTCLFLLSLIFSSSSYARNCTFFVSLSHNKFSKLSKQLSKMSLKPELDIATGHFSVDRNSDKPYIKPLKFKMSTKNSSSKQNRFPCPKCFYKLGSKYALRRHIKTKICQKNNSDAPFKCETCPRGYKMKSSLKRHIEHECGKESKIPCQFCEGFFKQKSTLVRHLKNACKGVRRSTSAIPLHPDNKNVYQI